MKKPNKILGYFEKVKIASGYTGTLYVKYSNDTVKKVAKKNKSILTEFHILSRFKHKNIIGVYNLSKNKRAFWMEHALHGDLYSLYEER